jgi:hypothetical protein
MVYTGWFGKSYHACIVIVFLFPKICKVEEKLENGAGKQHFANFSQGFVHQYFWRYAYHFPYLDDVLMFSSLKVVPDECMDIIDIS